MDEWIPFTSNNSLTKMAMSCLDKNYPNWKLQANVIENVTFDGCDDYGPVSEIYNLRVKYNGSVDLWCCENWYDGAFLEYEKI